MQKWLSVDHVAESINVLANWDHLGSIGIKVHVVQSRSASHWTIVPLTWYKFCLHTLKFVGLARKGDRDRQT